MYYVVIPGYAPFAKFHTHEEAFSIAVWIAHTLRRAVDVRPVTP